MPGGSQQATQTSTFEPPQQAKDIMDLAMPAIKQFAAKVPQRYQGETVAGFTPAQQQGQAMALQAAGTQGNLAAKGADTSNFLMGDIWNPATNPNLKGAIDAAVRPITENYQQVVKPGIRDTFQNAGQQFGGSRRFATEDLGAGQYLRSVGDTSSKIAQDEYNTNIDAMVKALGLLPQTQQAQVTPAATTSGVGDVQQNLDQQRIAENVNNYNYDQMAPFLQSQDLFSLLSAIPGGTTTSTANNPVSGTGQKILGGAATGAGLGAAILPGVGAAPGAALGSLLAFL